MTALRIGFMIISRFLIIVLVVASVLMAMGMMMLSPLIVSLPFKIMMFGLIADMIVNLRGVVERLEREMKKR